MIWIILGLLPAAGALIVVNWIAWVERHSRSFGAQDFRGAVLTADFVLICCLSVVSVCYGINQVGG